MINELKDQATRTGVLSTEEFTSEEYRESLNQHAELLVEPMVASLAQFCSEWGHTATKIYLTEHASSIVEMAESGQEAREEQGKVNKNGQEARGEQRMVIRLMDLKKDVDKLTSISAMDQLVRANIDKLKEEVRENSGFVKWLIGWKVDYVKEGLDPEKVHRRGFQETLLGVLFGPLIARLNEAAYLPIEKDGKKVEIVGSSLLNEFLRGPFGFMRIETEGLNKVKTAASIAVKQVETYKEEVDSIEWRVVEFERQTQVERQRMDTRVAMAKLRGVGLL